MPVLRYTLLLVLFTLSACTRPERDAASDAADDAEAPAGVLEATPPAGAPALPEEASGTDPVVGAALGQLVYVPVYSHIYFRDGSRIFNLTATLSIRNTDPDHPVEVQAVRYYDSAGRLVRAYLETPLTLAPLASTSYVIEEEDITGGVGANFLVRWQSAVPVSPPVVEAVMISTKSGQGISFVSPGRVIRSRLP